MLQNTLTGHSAAIFAVDMNADGSLVITGAADKVNMLKIYTLIALQGLFKKF